jgi:cyclic pyranopterin phosphate synthase
MPADGVEPMKHKDVLAFEEIVELVKIGVDRGIHKIRLTGGEPLVRKGIVHLVEMIANVSGIEDLALTTNGILLDQFAQPLANAGLNRVNVSLDTMNPERYHFITRGGDITKVFKGIEAARRAGLSPVKINCVVENASSEEDAQAVAEFARQEGLSIRFIHQMNLKNGSFSKVEGGSGGDCSSCNRLRLTANGCFKPCLFNQKGYNIREYGHVGAFEKAIQSKPAAGTRNQSGHFNQIGG